MDEQIVTHVGHNKAILRVLAQMASHPSVSNVGAPVLNETSSATEVEVTFDVSLPNEWKLNGESPSGVRLKEIVRFNFPAQFPMIPPGLFLRKDFNRNLPHMQPWLTNERPVPCIYDGSLTDLFYQKGMTGIVNQTAVWLEHAALGTLIDPNQGWEPVRRDSFNDFLIADADCLHGLVDRKGGYRFFGFNYLRTAAYDGSVSIHGEISAKVAKLNAKVVPDIFREIPLDETRQFRRGKSLALVVWPGKRPSGKLIINDTYLPETVTDINSLKKRAELYGCFRELSDSLSWLKQCLSNYEGSGSFILAVVLLARRPFNVIGSQSPIELCPYVVDIRLPELFADRGATAVCPAAHRHAIVRPLLVQMAGGENMSERPCWTLVGAGSLGSKLAIHLARAGNGPEIVIDKSAMTPHNAARHALIPMTNDMQILWMDAKAKVLRNALNGLDQETTPVVKDAINLLMSKDSVRRVSSRHSWAIVNATASPVVREDLASTKWVTTRVIETSLFAGGLVGMITVEGPNRNPNTVDLMAECYALLREDLTLASVVFNGDDTVSRQNIGQGCGSLTMPMSDGRLSLFAAGMAEYLLAKQRDGLPLSVGEILIGRLSEDGFGLKWQITQVPPMTVASTINRRSWSVHIHPRALKKIRDATACWQEVETGGVLMGRISESSRMVSVVDVLEPPEDSTRSADEFVLGTKGLRQCIKTYSDVVDWSLYCLGTWHSHLSPSGPSTTDRLTAEAIALACLSPSISLIHTPIGFSAFLADIGDARTGGE